MPSFDITSEADMVALKNAVDVAGRERWMVWRRR